MLNLAINARDAMPRGGRLKIATALADIGEDEAALQPDASPGRYVRLTVSDSGEGMAPEVLDRAIEPFFSTKEVGQGTGLGLSMVYGFVKQSGGHLTLESKQGSGATIEMFLPSSEDRPAVRPARQPFELAHGSGERILLCEDDSDVRRFSGETLRELGYTVIEAADTASALAALREHGRVDVLFTDIILPGDRTGADLARDARELQPDIKVLFTTGYARSALERPDSAVEILLKPFGVDDLAARLRAILD
jgi:CheY-like chemotaxis protein